MGWWKADPVPEASAAQPKASEATTLTLPSLSSTSTSSACPIDPKAREAFVRQALIDNGSQQSSKERQNKKSAVAVSTLTPASGEQCSSDRIDQRLPIPSPNLTSRPLSQEREVSSIPRAYDLGSAPSPNSKSTLLPSNAEAETGYDRSSGNWIYPSESQFFSAVMRKHPDATSPADLASSISSIIPIHNAVNERAWTMIRKWESDQPANKSCNGPKLLRFEGKGAGAKSPRAVMKSWSGYQEPFDRHDWTIQRCDGTQVDYIIDFYQGRSPSGQISPSSSKGSQGINFYLDVRPKLNSFEGVRMRFASFVGWS